MSTSRITPLAGALLLAAAAWTAPAAAQAPSASVSISQLGWELIDLNPGDGIAPEISFLGQTYRTDTSYSLPWSVTDSRTQYEAGENTLHFDRAWSTANVGDGLAQASSRLTTSGEFATASARSYLTTAFRLTPYTGVLFTALAELDGETAGLGAAGSARAYLRGNVGGQIGDTTGSYFEDDARSVNELRSHWLRGYVHSDALAADGAISFEANASSVTYNATSPVPEPASVGMLLAGLAVVGVGAARRRRA